MKTLKTNQIMKRSMGNFVVEQRTKDSMFNATHLLKQWNESNSDNQRLLSNFWKLEHLDEFMLGIVKDPENGFSLPDFKELEFSDLKKMLSSTSRGRADRGGGTWIHKKLEIIFIQWLEGVMQRMYCAKEQKFFDLLNIVNIDADRFNMIRQYPVLNYRVDAAIINRNVDNDDYYWLNTDKYDSIELIEFDEKHHKKNNESDEKRMREIVEHLKKEFLCITVIRVKEEDAKLFLKYAIPAYSGIGGAWVWDNLDRFVKIVEQPQEPA